MSPFPVDASSLMQTMELMQLRSHIDCFRLNPVLASKSACYHRCSLACTELFGSVGVDRCTTPRKASVKRQNQKSLPNVLKLFRQCDSVIRLLGA